MRRRDNTGVLIVSLFLAAVVVGVILFVSFSKRFERESVKIELPSVVYWNGLAPIKVALSDNIGVKSYEASIVQSGKTTALAMQRLDNVQSRIDISLSYPKNLPLTLPVDAVLQIKAGDGSWWNWFGGNETIAVAKIVMDTKAPLLSSVASSYTLSRGGSALVVFEARDENFLGAFIKEKSGSVFKCRPFYKPGFYAALVAWPVKNESVQLDLVATDKAGNISTMPLTFYLKSVLYKDSNIELKDNFLDSKIVQLASTMPQTTQTTPLDKFVYVNSTLRSQNEQAIKSVTSGVGDKTIDSYFTEPFLPISRAQVVGTFGDHRNFFYGGKQVSESYHMGIDFASVKEAEIFAPNDATVVFAADNGIYGNLVVLDHGLGFHTLYGHCSSIAVRVGDIIKKGQLIAKTGMTGLAMGDHLHYGTVVQGLEVRPLEWLDAHWIKVSITQVIQEAKTAIDGRRP